MGRACAGQIRCDRRPRGRNQLGASLQKAAEFASVAGDLAAIACIAQKSLKICERCRLGGHSGADDRAVVTFVRPNECIRCTRVTGKTRRFSFVCVRHEPFEKRVASLGKPSLELPCAIAIATGPGFLAVQVAAVSTRVRVFNAQ